MDDLSEVFDPGAVLELAGHNAYARGLGYQADGRVEIAAASSARAEAVVRGSMPYSVELWIDGAELAWSCTCPAAEDGSFCKHAVAVALELADPQAPRFPPAPAGKPRDRMDEPDLAAFVASLDHTRLVELVLTQVDADWRLRDRLTAESPVAAGDGPSVEHWKGTSGVRRPGEWGGGRCFPW